MRQIYCRGLSFVKFRLMILIIFLCYWQIGIGFSQETILLTFQAVAGDELTLLFWETRNETNLAGFVLLRSENDSSGNFNEIASYLQDSTLIAQGTEGCYSRRYSWLDLGLSNGTQYWYKLILIGKSSEQKSYGTAPVVPAEGKTIYQSTDDLGWEWQNPLPSGNYPCDVDFVDADHGWIVGERNTILRTTDGGRSWKFLNPGVGLPKTAGKFAHIDFEDVHFFDSLHGLVSGCIYCVFDDNDVINESIILKTNDGGETWKPTFQSQYPGARSPSLFFINSFEGWASVFPDKGIFRTEDGGNSWQFAGTYPPKFAADTTENGSIWYIDPYFSQLFFTTPDSGWGYPVERSLFLTSDGGCTWTRKEFLIGPEYDLFFTNRNMGYLIEAYDGKLYRTLDGGETWALYHTFNEGYFPYLIRFKSDAEGVIIGKNTLFKTNDGGENWISLPINFNHHPLELDFAADNGLWMVNWNIYVDNCADWVRHSTDGGLSWQSLYQGIYGDFIEVDFLNLEKGWVLGNDYNYQSEQNKGLILTTTNGGRNWHVQSIINEWLVALDMVDEYHGWCAAERYNSERQRLVGAIYHTKNGWQSWEKIEPYNQLISDLFSLDSLHAWAGGYHGEILLTDDGENWHRGKLISSDSTNLKIYNIFFADSNHGWATTHQGIRYPMYSALFQTKDGGMSWKMIWKSEQEEFLTKVVFIDSLHGWAIGGDPYGGAIYHTTDGGYRWIQQHPQQPYERLIGLCIVDNLYGWVLGEYGKIIYTQNAGQTWLEQPRLAEGLTAMTFVDPAHGWVVGYDGKILHTAQAGLAKQTASRMSSQIKPDLATNYQLYQNYPNPFNPITTIRYNLPQNDKVTLKIYNLLGQEVKTFFNLEHQLAGQHQVIWDGCDINGYPSTSGVYFAVLSGSNWKRTMKLVLIK